MALSHGEEKSKHRICVDSFVREPWRVVQREREKECDYLSDDVNYRFFCF